MISPVTNTTPPSSSSYSIFDQLPSNKMGILSLAILLSLSITVYGKPEYRQELPNADATPLDGLPCKLLGHDGCNPGNSTNNQFARDFRAAGYKYTKAFCRMDSDGDGVSNGAELGDPCCDWSKGKKPHRSDDLSHPGDKNSVPDKAGDKFCNTADPAKEPLSPVGQPRPLITVDPVPSAPTSPPPSNTPELPSEDTASTTTVGEEGTAAEASPEPAAGRVCFPGDATVVLESGDVISMEKLEVGHRVQVGLNEYSDVVMFTHALPDATHSFVRLTTVSGKAIRATEGHHIYADGKLTRMGNVALGNALYIPASGAHEKVVNIARETGRGLYNPQTAHGDIVVNHIRASTYTHTIPNKAAHAMLAPVRAAFEWTGLRISALEKIVW